MKAHKHAKFIKAWADGAEIETSTASGWQPIGRSPSWSEGNVYRIKPVTPDHVYPETLLTDDETNDIGNKALRQNGVSSAGIRRAIANAALRHACDSRQIVPWAEHKAKVDEAVNFGASAMKRMARDMAAMQRGPGGYPLLESEIESIALSIMKRYVREN